jgi:hypothetical protein
MAKGMTVVALKVQGQIERPDQAILKLPGPLVNHPADEGISPIH